MAERPRHPVQIACNGVDRAFRLAENLARDMGQGRAAGSSRSRNGGHSLRYGGGGGGGNGGGHRQNQSREPILDSSSAVAADAVGSQRLSRNRIKSPWFTTVLGPPIMAECWWRWVFGPEGWEATQMRLRRSQGLWVEVEWDVVEGREDRHIGGASTATAMLPPFYQQSAESTAV